MYISNEDFEKWMEKLSKKLNDIGRDLKSLINTDKVFEPDEKLLDNQDLAFLLKVSKRTLQRYRSEGKLPYFMIGHKTYYKVNDVRVFVHSSIHIWTIGLPKSLTRSTRKKKIRTKKMNDSAFLSLKQNEEN